MRHARFQDIGLEAIDFQSGALFSDLVEAFAKVRGVRAIKQKDLDDVDIPGIVRAHTNMGITFQIREEGQYNAFVVPPQFDKNHPFFQEHIRPYLNSTGVDLIKKLGGKARAGVDRKTGKVTGVYGKITAEVFITRGMIDSKEFSDGEVAAVILHELGHLYTYFEYLGNAFTANYVINAATSEIMKTNDIKQREVILLEAEKVLGVKADKDKIIAMRDKAAENSIAVIYLSELAEKSRSELGTNLYDVRAWEQLSDQFATRHGAGKDLVTALNRMYQTYGHPSTFGPAGFLANEALKALTLSATILVPLAIPGMAPFAVFGFLYLLASMILLNPQDKVYDDPEARIKMVRLQVQSALKQDVTDRQRKALLEDIEMIQAVEDQLTDRRPLVEFMWAKVFPWGKKSASQAEMMKDLEELAHNELFVAASKFKLGAKNA